MKISYPTTESVRMVSWSDSSVRKLLNSGVGDDAPASSSNNNNGSHNNAVASAEKKKMPRCQTWNKDKTTQYPVNCFKTLYSLRFTKSDHEALVDIFKKIGQKELTKVGQLKEVCSLKIFSYSNDSTRWAFRSSSLSSKKTLMLTLSLS